MKATWSMVVVATSVVSTCRRLKARVLLRTATAVMHPLKSLHTGRIGDYTAALALGVGTLGALFSITLR